MQELYDHYSKVLSRANENVRVQHKKGKNCDALFYKLGMHSHQSVFLRGFGHTGDVRAAWVWGCFWASLPACQPAFLGACFCP